MKTLFKESLFPTDIMYRNIFDRDSIFKSIMDTKPGYPVDVYTKDDELHIDIAVIDGTKEYVDITTDGSNLKVKYTKPDEDDTGSKYFWRSITKRSFDFAWKISPKYDLNSVDAEMQNGLLKITLMPSKEAEGVKVKIK
jgi:HSP20 family molecular chaperone IbpA